MQDFGRKAPTAVEIAGVAYAYGANPVLRGIDVTLPAGQVLALLGSSGSGKTTLLKLVAGLLTPSAGRIRIGAAVVADASANVFVPPERRGLGMVFQDYALWPHLSVGENVAFPLEMRGVPPLQARQRIAAALERVALTGFETRRPDTLSGGQQQRVAIARAIVAEPDVVLFDEPLSNLDKELRDDLIDEIATLVRSLGLTAIYVTHEQSEAFAIADRVAIMGGGHIVQLGTPEDLVGAPANAAVAEFLNLGVLARAERRDDSWWLTDAGIPLVRGGPAIDGNSAAMRVLLGRKALRICRPEETQIHGIVVKSTFRGDAHSICLRLGDGKPGIDVIVASEQRATPGERLGIAIDPNGLRWFEN